jgi:RsiW-degrading membrane proteinase PrsW (M82 family)
LLSFLFLRGSLFSFQSKTGSVLKITFSGIVKSTEGHDFEFIEKTLPLAFILILIVLLPVIAILLFKRRNIQLLLSKIIIGLVSCLILACGHITYLTMTKYSAEIIPDIKIALPFLMLIFSILAHRGIRKDDQLVKSYDRLR